MKISIINFSGRPNGNCHNIAKVIERAMSVDNEIVLKEMYSQDITPCGKCNYECFNKDTECPYIDDDVFGIYSSICSSELAYYIVPNYCDYPSSSFFIFHERGQCFFQKHSDSSLNQYDQVKKKFIVVSNTGKDNFRQAFKYHVKDGSNADILFLSAKAFKKVSLKGDLMDSEEAKLLVEEFAW